MIKRKGKACRNKHFEVLSYNGLQFVLVAYEDGTIQIWDTKLKEQLIHQDIKKRINAFDHIMINDILLMASYSNNGCLNISLINLKVLLDDMSLVVDKTTVYREVKNLQISMANDHSADDEAKFVMMNILWLDKNSLLISGKTGEIF